MSGGVSDCNQQVEYRERENRLGIPWDENTDDTDRLKGGRSVEGVLIDYRDISDDPYRKI